MKSLFLIATILLLVPCLSPASPLYFDEETGLHYNCNRYFDSATGCYIQTDPIGFAAGRQAPQEAGKYGVVNKCSGNRLTMTLPH